MLRLETLGARHLAYAFLAGAPHWPQPGGPGTPVMLSYSVGTLDDGGLSGALSPAAAHDAVVRALSVWAAHAPLYFVEVGGGGDLTFGRGNVPLGNLAQTDGGHVTVDDGPAWGTGAVGGGTLPLDMALTHEAGHALGLAHELHNAAIMNPAIRSGVFDGLLYDDDAAGVHALYGAGTGRVDALPPPGPPPAPGVVPPAPYPGYRGAVATAALPASGAVATLAADAEGGHVEVFDAAGGTLASFLAYPGYRGRAVLWALAGQVVTLAPEQGHVRGYLPDGTPTASYLVGG